MRKKLLGPSEYTHSEGTRHYESVCFLSLTLLLALGHTIVIGVVITRFSRLLMLAYSCVAFSAHRLLAVLVHQLMVG